MISYNFVREFAPQISTGAPTPKTLSMRRDRKHPSRHADVGEPIGLWTGMRTKEAIRRGVGLVMLRATMKFSEAGIEWVQDLRVRDQIDLGTEALQQELKDSAADAFA